MKTAVLLAAAMLSLAAFRANAADVGSPGPTNATSDKIRDAA